jgi:succinoglycan biosynthesis transport protein ExoP
MPAKPQDAISASMADYWNIIHRRFWWISLSIFFCWLGVWAFSWFMPAIYQSDAMILVEQQKVPENYVTSNVTVNLQDRLQSMTQQILSRTRLQTTIDRFHLYPPDKRLHGLAQEKDPIELMRKDIKIDLVRSPEHAGELTAFKIEYSAATPELAQQVNNELTSLFIDENLKEQQQQSESTTAFLSAQLADARTRLEEQEAKVQAYKAAHFGDLPSQVQSNVQILAGLQAQLLTAQRDLDIAKQQKLYLETQLEQYESVRPANRDTAGPAPNSPEAFDAKLNDLRLQLADARSRFSDKYPDVIALQNKIAETEKLKKQSLDEIALIQKANKEKSAASRGMETTAANATPTMMQIQSQLKVNQLETENLQKQEADVKTQISSYQTRLNLTPRTEQELAEVSRGYDESLANYNSLLQKQNQSMLATSLEQRQQGEQFRILDPPSLPTKPTSPNHFKVSLIGLILGVFVGLVLASLLEMTQPRVWQARDLEKIVPARILVALPHLSTPKEDRRSVMVRSLRIAVTAVMVILILFGNLYAFYRG